MPPKFQQVMPYAGMDEHTPSGGTGIIVPVGPWGNAVILADGPGLQVDSKNVQWDEITDPARHPNWANLLPLFHKLKTGAIRIINITSDSSGIDNREVTATNMSPHNVVRLTVAVLKQKVVTISIRPTQVRDDHGNWVSFNAPVDPQSLLEQMNSIWGPQANIVFKLPELARTDPASIDGLSPEAKFDLSMVDKALKENTEPPPWFKSFANSKDPAADLTMFLVRRVFHGGEPVKGTTRLGAGLSWISDDRSDRTMAHEAGHFLLGEPGHPPPDDPDFLMPEGGPGRKIPYSLATSLNLKLR
ncbi:MAG: hypothetical protein WCA20_32220 [Candidatus Sulfotelmatobacter sp.]